LDEQRFPPPNRRRYRWLAVLLGAGANVTFAWLLASSGLCCFCVFGKEQEMQNTNKTKRPNVEFCRRRVQKNVYSALARLASLQRHGITDASMPVQSCHTPRVLTTQSGRKQPRL
jgi:hypothetical protein